MESQDPSAVGRPPGAGEEDGVCHGRGRRSKTMGRGRKRERTDAWRVDLCGICESRCPRQGRTQVAAAKDAKALGFSLKLEGSEALEGSDWVLVW